MIEVIGDFWEHAKDHQGLVCTLNQVKNKQGQLIMGAGIAKEFVQYFPYLPYVWGKGQISQDICINYGCMKKGNSIQGFFLLGMFTKTHWKLPSDIDFVVGSCKKLVKCCNDLFEFGLHSILMPRPGCGKGGLEWKEVKKKIKPFLDDRFTIINKN